MTTSKQYDYLNRLTQISSAPGAAYTQPLTFNYNYNPANQRTKDTLADGSYWMYGYDSLGQVTNGCKYFANGSPVAGQQFDYTFDTIGNRTQTQAGGDTNGINLRVANYTNNVLNQITRRDVPPYVDVMGASILTNSVTVNGQTAYRRQEYFRQQLPANNSTSALWTNITVSGGQSVTGNVYVAQEPETFQYDSDGNLTNDGRWVYSWDGENRLIQMTVNTNVGPQYQLDFAYDFQGRRIQKLVFTNGVGIYTNNFLYDRWNLAATLTPNSQLQSSYLWGCDLSGSLQRAGGVGGLLKVSFYGSTTTNCFPAFDGNGNVMGLVNVSDGTLAANYDYGPFGEVIRSSGPMAKTNPMRFSTKYQDDESDLLYYGYRYYKPSTGTWPNRDPNDDESFATLLLHKGAALDLNLYMFLADNSVNYIDYLGLKEEPPSATDHCHDPCGWAKDHMHELGLDTDYGVTVCCNGKKYGCVLKPGGNATDPTAQQIITECIQAHEDSHVNDPNSKCKSFCGWTGPMLAKYKNRADSTHGECNAWTVTYDCLKGKISRCNGNSDCEAQINQLINYAEFQVETYCGGKKPSN
jgi:RHS repeat-associated protein